MILLNIRGNDPYCSEEYADPYPASYTIELSDALAERIMHLNEIAIKENVGYISDYNTSFSFYDVDLDEITDDTEPMNTELDYLHVDKTSFWFSGILKHTDIKVETSMISILTIKECLKVKNTEIKDLPLLVNDLESDEAKELLRKRLNGTSIEDCTFISVWDDGIRIESKASYDTISGEIFVKETHEVEGVDILQDEYIILPNGDEIKVCKECHEYIMHTVMVDGEGHTYEETQECMGPDCSNKA